MILVTGHEGFIGSALSKFLKGKGYKTIGMEKPMLDMSNWQYVVLKHLETYDPDVVFHVGACADTQNHDVNYMMKYNAECTMLISDWCKRRSRSMIYSSSASCYGIDGSPNTLYGWSKYLGEQSVIANNQVALRYFNVYGHNEDHKHKMASVAYQSYLKQYKGEEVKLFPCFPRRDFIYIKDVVYANYLALKNYRINKGNRYDVGTGVARTFEDVMNIMGLEYNYLNSDEIPQGYQFYTEADKDNFLNGWKPYYSLEEGLDTYIRTLASFSGSKHMQ
jgi:ADP-L-glycero-D-manno-heptose 6-epimerase